MNFTNKTIDFTSLTDDEIQKTLDKYRIALTAEEALKIQREILHRPPSLTECILWSIQGSEHSSYKSSRIHLAQFVTQGPNVILGPKEDAGVVAVAEDFQGHRYGIVISHESHNHPSQIVPYEGAATGVGGNVRDVACMGAEVIAIADSLRFGQIDSPKTQWIHEGVVAGIGGYGNPIGVPNVGGDITYDEGYNENCLVTVVTLGIVREDEIIHSSAPSMADGYELILVGKPTDNSGFGGASFASLELAEEKKEKNKGAVQEPNAFLERHLLKATYALFRILKEKGLMRRVGLKDLGAGGIACASVELADSGGYGADVYLDRVFTSMNHLHPSVILCSETQERFMWVCPKEVTPLILKHYNETFALPKISKGAEAKVIGNIRADGKYRVHYDGETVVEAPANQVTRGLQYQRPYKSDQPNSQEPNLQEPHDYNELLLKILSHENVASRDCVFDTYDKQVQGRTLLEAGEADAGVLKPFDSKEFPEEIRSVGVALSLDHNPRYCKIDPYWGAVNAVVESMRNVAAVGATPQAITDCLCFGNPEKPHQMGQFVEAVRAIADTCKAIHLKEHPSFPVPIIAGNVSFYNESQKGAIPPSPIISCLGKLNDVKKVVTPRLKKPDSILLMIGDRKDECGGSVYYSLFSERSHRSKAGEEAGKNVPKPDFTEVENQIFAITDAIEAGLVSACHDISEGGIAIALAEMTFYPSLLPTKEPVLSVRLSAHAEGPSKEGWTASRENHLKPIGCQVEVPGDLRNDKKLFSETGGFILEVSPENVSAVQNIFSTHDVTAHIIGKTTQKPEIRINRKILIPVPKAYEAWLNGLKNKLSS